jgi:hypothetical protein
MYKKRKKFPSYNQTKKIVAKLHLNSAKEYRCGINPIYKKFELPSAPERIYLKEWEGWAIFLGKRKKWPSFVQAKIKVKKAKITSSRTYIKLKLYKKLNLPQNPKKIYKRWWKGWENYFGLNKFMKIKIINYKEAKILIQKLGIKSKTEYFKKKIFEFNLPNDPANFYKEEWEGWTIFTGNNIIINLKKNLKKLGFSYDFINRNFIVHPRHKAF